jgi:hypothetical protein
MIMGIKRVSRFQASDGKLFDHEYEARDYENRMVALNELVALLKESASTGRADAVLRHIVEESSAVRAILFRYTQRTPKAVRLAKVA